MQKKNNDDAALLIFIKNAEKGKVKTRLANTVGAEKALQIYRALMAHTCKVAQSVSANRLLFYSNFIEAEDEWPINDFHKYIQQGNDLGERMQQAFSLAFQSHQKVVIIGSDCASLSPDILTQAFQLLDQHAFVVGPAMDGGYYLLGMRQFSPKLFSNMAWSTEAVFPETLQRIKALNASYALLPELSDIDFEEDWQKYGWPLP
ncbi:MAG: TIGR04282 family arsenosugar biosynthesis glycosyltransferase [Bacteroidota bacterium]